MGECGLEPGGRKRSRSRLGCPVAEEEWAEVEVELRWEEEAR